MSETKLKQFEEPFEMQEWNDIGADLRIYIRRQFYGIKTQNEKLQSALVEEKQKVKELLDLIVKFKNKTNIYQSIYPDDKELVSARNKANELIKKHSGEGK